MDIKEFLISDDQLNIIDNGAWVPVAGWDDVEFKVCGLTSKEAQKVMKKEQAAARQKNRGKELTIEQLANCTKKVLYNVILKDWKGLKQNGKDLPYSKELAKEWITSRNGEAFTEKVLDCSRIIDEDAADFVEEVTKK